MHECVWCGGPAGRMLCPTCKLGLVKYTAMNEPIVRAYVDAGLAMLEVYLGPWAKFAEWEEEARS